jgi:processive 1,2-diacylglycerol beta-glucosyltransferase
MSKKTLALFSVSAGAGHVRAAQAFEKAAEVNFPDINVVHLDLMDVVPKLFKTLYAESYLKIIRYEPALWGALYQKTDKTEKKSSPKLRKIRETLQDLNTREFVKVLKNLKPDWIICTHFLPADIISQRIGKGKMDVPTWVQITDYDAHALWLHPNVTGYFAGNEETAYRLSERGIPSEKIYVTGIPVMPVFKERYPRAELSAEFGIEPDKFTVLLMSGGEGVNAIDLIAERLIRISPDIQVIALSGRNEKLLARLKEIENASRGRVKACGFTKTIERFMAVADVAVTKSGGLTSAECMATGLPMVILSPIPGQEERNADYLLESGTALKACDGASVEFKIRQLMNLPEKLSAMKQAARAIAKPDAAYEAIKKVLDK